MIKKYDVLDDGTDWYFVEQLGNPVTLRRVSSQKLETVSMGDLHARLDNGWQIVDNLHANAEETR